MPEPGGRRVTAWLAALLFTVLPFEPRGVSLAAGPFRVTWLEAEVALLLLGLAWTNRDRLLALARRPRPPLVAISLYAAAHLLSASVAPSQADLAFKFALRIVVMAGCAWVVAAAWPRGRMGAWTGLAVSGGLVAVLAIAEGTGARSLDPFLALFRETPFNVAGSRRASAGSEYPNLAAGFLMYGLLGATGLATARRLTLAVVVPAAAVLGLALFYTYSRGALLAAAIGLAALALAARRRRAGDERVPLAALGALVLSFAVFAGTTEIQRLRFGTEGIGSWYQASYAPEEPSIVMRPEEIRVTGVAVTNTGRKTWVVADGFHLSYHWYHPGRKTVADGGRTRLPKDIAPGETAALRAELNAPREPGEYLLVWDMVHEHSTWFSGQGVKPAVVPARIGVPPSGAPSSPPRPEPVDGLADLAWRPGRLELWTLAWQMWRERPIVGVGSDNFRWLHGPRAGKAHWDRRVFANNLYVEIAATTGLLGLTALLWTLASALLAAWRRSGEAGAGGADGPALFALVVGMSVHGVVDYLFAFTGHYLLFGAVIGACAALASREHPA